MPFLNIRRMIGVSAILALAAASGLTLAAPSENSPDESRTLKFNVSPNGYPPYIIVSEDDYSGIIWDVVTHIADRLDYVVEPRKIPRKRVDQMLLDGYIDATPRAIEWTENPDQFVFSDPIVQVQEVFFVPVDSTFEYTTLDDLRSKILVTHLGYKYPALAPLLESGELQRFDVSEDSDMFDYLLHGRRFDAAVADRLLGQWIIRQENLQGKVRYTTNNISDYGFRLMLRPEWQPFVDQFNEELADLRASGKLEHILSSYR